MQIITKSPFSALCLRFMEFEPSLLSHFILDYIAAEVGGGGIWGTCDSAEGLLSEFAIESSAYTALKPSFLGVENRVWMM